MPKIIITRSNQWVNRRRTLKLTIDGKEVGEIKNDEVLEFEVMPGQHTVLASWNWLSSNIYDVNIGANENRYVRLSGFKYSNAIQITGMVVIFSYILIIEKFFRGKNPMADYFFYGFIGLYFLIMVYNITIGRKKYFWIREDIK